MQDFFFLKCFFVLLLDFPVPACYPKFFSLFKCRNCLLLDWCMWKLRSSCENSWPICWWDGNRGQPNKKLEIEKTSELQISTILPFFGMPSSGVWGFACHGTDGTDEGSSTGIDPLQSIEKFVEWLARVVGGIIDDDAYIRVSFGSTIRWLQTRVWYGTRDWKVGYKEKTDLGALLLLVPVPRLLLTIRFLKCFCPNVWPIKIKHTTSLNRHVSSSFFFYRLSFEIHLLLVSTPLSLAHARTHSYKLI